MNAHRCWSRRRAWIGYVIAVCSCVPALAADAPHGAGSGIPPEAVQASDATSYKGAIDTFIKTQLDKLKDKSPASQKEAREMLVNQTATVGGTPPSASFISEYAASLDSAVIPLAQDPNMRTRLNIAIVVARVAKSADNDQLKSAVETLLKDKSDPVALWAMKGAGSLLPYYLRNPANTPPALLDAMVKSVQDHSNSAGVAQEAYDAASLGLPDRAKDVTPAMREAVIPEMQNLLDGRLQAYVTSIPEEPRSENKATSFFAQQAVWQAQTPDQKKRSMQLICNLISVCAQRAATATNPADRKEFLETLSNAAKAILVIGQLVEDPKIEAASKFLGQVNPSIPDTQVGLRFDTLIGALQGNAVFKGVTTPDIQVKPVNVAAPADAPTSSPVTEEHSEEQ